MPKTTSTTDRAHVILSFDINQSDFNILVDEVMQSKLFPHLIGLEVKRPNVARPVIGLGALLLRKATVVTNVVEPQQISEDEDVHDEDFVAGGDDHDE